MALLAAILSSSWSTVVLLPPWQRNGGNVACGSPVGGNTNATLSSRRDGPAVERKGTREGRKARARSKTAPALRDIYVVSLDHVNAPDKLVNPTQTNREGVSLSGLVPNQYSLSLTHTRCLVSRRPPTARRLRRSLVVVCSLRIPGLVRICW